MNYCDRLGIARRQIATVMITFRHHEVGCHDCLENRFCDYGSWLLGLVEMPVWR